MRTKQYKVFAADFETTVYEGQEYTEVWASGLCPLYTEDVVIFHSIGETYDFLKSLKCNVMVYYHNLKFDGTFWLSYLLDVLKMPQAYIKTSTDSEFDVKWLHDKDMKNDTFKYTISDRGQWYSIIIRTGGHFIEIRDSLKLMPFSLAEIAKGFNTKHKKLDMNYTGFRYAGCPITEEERRYLENDVFVLKEALEFMYDQGHNDLTIGSCCLSEFKALTGKHKYADLFPDLTSMKVDKSFFDLSKIDPNAFLRNDADNYIRKSYRGGWCYLVEGKAKKKHLNGFTADVNSLYPSMMHSESGNVYPVGVPTFWKGDFIPEEATRRGRYYFIRIKTRFYLKKGYLPFIQIKGSWLYKGTESLKTSDIKDPETGKTSRFYIDLDGKVSDSAVILTLTQTDFALLKEHYDLKDLVILDGCFFDAKAGIFDTYIDKYKKIKAESKGAKRTLAKLF